MNHFVYTSQTSPGLQLDGNVPHMLSSGEEQPVIADIYLHAYLCGVEWTK